MWGSYQDPDHGDEADQDQIFGHLLEDQCSSPPQEEHFLFGSLSADLYFQADDEEHHPFAAWYYLEIDTWKYQISLNWMASIILILPLLFIFAIVWLCLTSEYIEVENIDQEGCQ